MDPYVGEIRLFAGNYAPRGWALCDGSIMHVQQNPALFAVIGNQYGGDGQTTFALPNLQGKAPMGQGAGPGLTPRAIATAVGEKTQTLTLDQIPSHTHVPNASNATSGGVDDPANAVWGARTNVPASNRAYSATANTDMNPLALSAIGGGQPHNNMQPYLVLNFIIALEGVFPPKS